jgi:hypothetical protein
VIRAAISAHIRTRRSDLEFQQGLRLASSMLGAEDYR